MKKDKGSSSHHKGKIQEKQRNLLQMNLSTWMREMVVTKRMKIPPAEVMLEKIMLKELSDISQDWKHKRWNAGRWSGLGKGCANFHAKA